MIKTVALIIVISFCGKLLHEFGEFVDDITPDSHKEERNE